MKSLSSSDWNLLRDISPKELSNLGMLLPTKVFMILPVMILRNRMSQNHGGQNHEDEDSISWMALPRRLTGLRHRLARSVVIKVARMAKPDCGCDEWRNDLLL